MMTTLETRRNTRLWLGSVLLLVALAACGGDPAPESSREGSTPAVEAGVPVTPTPTRAQSISTLPSSSPTSEFTPSLAFERLHNALLGDGASIFHTTMTQTVDHDGRTTEMWTLDLWIDVSRQVARSEYQRGPGGSRDSLEESTTILANDLVYIAYPGESMGQPFTAQRCLPGEQPLVLSFFICDPAVGGNGGAYPFVGEAASVQLEQGIEYDGRQAVVLLFEQGDISARLFLDAATFLPIAWTREMPGTNWQHVVRFANEFVAPDSLPADFFDPVALGYQEPAAWLANPDLGVTPYWLGPALDPANGLPPLILTSVGPDCCAARAVLAYHPADPNQASSGVVMRIWHPTDWESWLHRDPATDPNAAVFRLFWDAPCAESKEITLDGGRAVIYMSHRSAVPVVDDQPHPVGEGAPPTPTPAPMVIPTPVGGCTAPFDRFLAHVFLGDTIVTINDAHFFEQPADAGMYQNPYNSVEGMETVIRALRPYGGSAASESMKLAIRSSSSEQR